MKEQREIQAGDTCVACGATVRAPQDPGSAEQPNSAASPTWLCDCDGQLGPQVTTEDPDGD